MPCKCKNSHFHSQQTLQIMKIFNHLGDFYFFYTFFQVLVNTQTLDQHEVEFLPIPTNLQSIAKLDIKIYELLKNINQNQEFKFKKDYKTSTGTIDEVEETKLSIVTSHPFLTLRMLYRITFDLEEIENQLVALKETDIWSKIQIEVARVKSIVGWSGEKYFDEILMGIIKIYETYELDLNEFVNGFLLNKHTSYTLQSRHCYSIGEYAVEMENYAVGIEWLEMAKSLALKEGNYYQNIDTITEYLSYAVQMHDYEFDQISNRFSNKLFVNALAPYQFKGFVPKLKQSTMRYRDWKGTRNINRRNIDFKGLCAGENYQTDLEKSKLHCKLETKSNPFFFINPLKIEVLSIEPYIIQVYNVISDSIISKLKNYSETHLNRATVMNTNHISKYSNSRTSLNTWISSDDFPEADSVFTRRIELITGLKIISSDFTEFLQVAIYNFGGYFSVHVDMTTFQWENGGRMATFMYYLNDVEVGGYTAFPVAGVAAKPIKGSGVFWYNTLPNGQLDTRTYHGACPVVLGEPKWVANKWIRFQGTCTQELFDLF